MKIDFKTLPMMELRSAPGDILDRVARDGEVFIVERNGQPKACLVPVSFLMPDIAPERITEEINLLQKNRPDYRLTITDEQEIEIRCPVEVDDQQFAVSVVLPHGYPTAAPRVYAHTIPADTPHLWPDGSLSIFGRTAIWNGKTYNAHETFSLAQAWLEAFVQWRKSVKAPKGGRK